MRSSHADGELARAADRAGRGAGLRLRGVHARWREVAGRLGHARAARASARGRAQRAQATFERDFWLEREEMIALALDGDKTPLRA